MSGLSVTGNASPFEEPGFIVPGAFSFGGGLTSPGVGPFGRVEFSGGSFAHMS